MKLSVKSLTMILLAVVFASVGYSQTFGSKAATRPVGEVEFITYKDSIDDGNRIGSVDIATTQGGSGLQCKPSSGTTDSNDGSNHGKLHLACQTALNGGPLTYKFVSASRDGYVVSPNSPHKEGDAFHVDSKGKTTFSIVMKYVGQDSTQSGPAPPSGGVAPPTSAQNGQVDFITYADNIKDGSEIGNVRIVTDEGGSKVQCAPNFGTTDATDSNNKGHLHLTCPSGANGGSRTYKFLAATRDGYEIDPSSPHKPGDEFHISGDNTTTFSILMRKLPGATASQIDSQDKPQQQVVVNPNRPPESQKNGRVQVTTYVYDNDGTRDRIGGINVHIQSVGRDTRNSAESCDEYNKTSDTAGNAKTNPNYGQLHFTNCWTGAGGTKAYQLSFAKLPDNLLLKDFKITGPGNSKFLSGSKTSLGDIQEQFNVLKNQETTLEINLVTRKDASKNANVSQIVTQNGTRFVANNSDPASKKAAAALNAIGGGHLTNKKIKGYINSAGSKKEEDPDNSTPTDDAAPSTPGNLKATQDESGAIKLTWDASVGNPQGEKVYYDIERALAESPDDGDSITDDSITDTAVVDKNDLKYPQTYVYSVVASDEDGNESDPATITITTKTLTANVRGAHSEGFISRDNNSDTVIKSNDGQAALMVPPDSSGNDLACDVSDGSDVPTDSLDAIGEVDGTYSASCSDDSGDDVDEFDDYVDETFYDDEDSDAELYAYNGSDWVKVPTSEADKAAAANATSILNSNQPFPIITANKTYKDGKVAFTIKSKKLYAFALVKVNKPNKITIATSVIVGAILCSFITGVIFIRQRMNRNYFEFEDSDVTSME